MKRLVALAIALSVLLVALSINTVSAAGCTTVQTSKGSLTAALADPGAYSGTLDATGCQIGVYFDKDGSLAGAAVSGATQYGVFVDAKNQDVTVNISGSHIYNIGDNPFSGNQYGVGIYYYGFQTPFTVSGQITGNQVELYQKAGIVVNGSNATATVTNNTVTGLGAVNFIAQNGIQFGYGATGTVQGNTVDGGNYYSGSDWTATGILVFEASGVSVQGNTVTNSQTGVDIETWCWFVPTADNNKVVNNTISGADSGVSVGAAAWNYSTCDPSADNNKVTNNVITREATTDSSLAGASVWTSDASTYTPSATNNKVIGNDITGYATSIDYSTATNTKAQANTP